MKWVWSYAIWSAWLLLFLVLELLGEFRVGPWVTLSETSWHAEDTYRILYELLCGFLVGLTLHIGMKVPLGRAVAYGIVVAVGGHLLNKAWP